jgi:hypothetical protein
MEWNEKNGKCVPKAGKVGIDWWRYQKVSSLHGSPFLINLHSNLKCLPDRES